MPASAPSAPDAAPGAALPAARARPAEPGLPLTTFLLRPFLWPFLVLLGVGVAVLIGVDRNVSSKALVTDSQTRLILINSLVSDLNAMENGQRGFVLTGQPDFLEPFTTGRSTFQANVFALHDLSVSGAQRGQLAQVRALEARWLTEAATPEIKARRTSLTRAAALVGDGNGRSILNRARAVLGTMGFEENARLSAASSSSVATLNTVRWIVWGGLTLGVVLVLLTALRVARTVGASVRDVTDSAREMAAGQYHLRLPAMPVRELTALGQQFDAMAAAVQQRERALRSLNDQLERSNRELEQFAYVASHDLQEPLRTIGSYTELLARRYGGQLDARADQYIAFTTEAAGRMKTLIQDLLTFSRVRRSQRAFGAVDTAALVAEVLADLQAQVQASGGRVEVGPLPTAYANADLLRHIFQNLIGNALKFSVPGRAPLVRVGAAREPGRWVFSVQDNGIGIEAQYHERIFGVFQRLHGMGEYSGSGIGLSVTRSAAEQHGGALWLDSRPGEGSTFYFSLPDAPEDAPPATAAHPREDRP